MQRKFPRISASPTGGTGTSSTSTPEPRFVLTTAFTIPPVCLVRSKSLIPGISRNGRLSPFHCISNVAS
jgi:hypothetical protein